MMWEEKVKRTEMSLFQEEFVRRGLRLVHDAPDQVNPAVDTCIGYAAVLGAEVFTDGGDGRGGEPSRISGSGMSD